MIILNVLIERPWAADLFRRIDKWVTIYGAEYMRGENIVPYEGMYELKQKTLLIIFWFSY
jgi:hypothetical protein